MKKTFSIIVAFVFGQLVQLALHATGLAVDAVQQISLCAGVGAAITVAVIVGVLVARRESERQDAELDPPTIIDAHWRQMPVYKGVYYED